MSNYIKATGINYSGTLSKIKKKNQDFLQPIYEAFTNSLEAIKLLKKQDNVSGNGSIEINLFVTKTLIGSVYDFSKIEIIDTGIGFNDKEFNRLVNLNDQGKGFSNKGTGRIQFLHSFDKTIIESIYKDENSKTGFQKRIFTISKSESFLKNNAIIRLEEGNEKDVQAETSCTSLTFKTILSLKDDESAFNLTAKRLKASIIEHYLVYFCENRDNLPKILIKRTVDKNTDCTLTITSVDIPEIDKEQSIDIHYRTLDNGEIKKMSKKEKFKLKAFKISKDELSENALKLVSKGEIAKSINLENLLPADQIENNRYLFLLSGEYIDNKDSDIRGEIKILKEEELKKQAGDLFKTEEILLDNIERQTNDAIIKMYDEIREKNEEKLKNIEELKKMFLLNQKTLDSLKKTISINDTDDIILKKVYKADAEIIAKSDAEIKKQIKNLNELNTTNRENYNEELQVKVDEFVKLIPQQNRTALTRYVARRKLVLELFQKIIKKELTIQKEKKNINEQLLHNLIFQQTSENPESSDLWLVSEEFIYFKGTSEKPLGGILLDNETIIKDDLSPEEEKYRFKQEGDANKKRPDILLFPKEGKCIIIEFKSLNIKASDHLTQINKYASLINNLSKDKFKITTYYGYFIGENIDIDDIQDNDSDFVSAHQLDFIFRPYKKILGKFGKSNGSLYIEVIKYSTLLKRALIRNKIFIDKIMKPVES